jgi:hypothetical protein
VDPRGAPGAAPGRPSDVPHELAAGDDVAHELESEGPATDRLLRPYFGMHRVVWPDEDGAVEFHLPHGEMLRVLQYTGFEVEDLVEIQVPEGVKTRFPWVTSEWASKWPAEEVWKARKK